MEASETILIRGARGKLAVVGAIAALSALGSAWLGFLAIALALTNPAALLDAEGRYALLRPFSPVLAPILSLWLAYLAYRAARKWADPPFLEIGPEGVSQTALGQKATWRWDEIDSLEFDPWKGRIIFNGDRSDGAGRFGRFPQGLDVSVRQLFDMLVAGKRRWGSAALVQEAPKA